MQDKLFTQIDALNKDARKEINRNPDRALELAEEAITKSSESGYLKGVADGTFVKGWCLLVKNNSEKASKFLEDSLEIYKSIGSKTGIIRTLNAFGVLHSNLSNYDTAMDNYLQSVNLSKQTGNRERLFVTYINIGNLYNEINKNDKALEYFDQAIELMDETTSPEQLCACYINIGDAYEKKGELENAHSNYSKALDIAEKNNIQRYRSNCLTSLGKICQNRNNFEEAEKFHLRSMDIAENLEDNLSKAECLTNLAELYRLKSDYKKAVSYNLQALELSERINSGYYRANNLFGLFKNYEATEDYPRALEYHKRYHEMYKKLQNEKVEERVKTLQAQHRIETARRENETQEQKNKQLEEAFDRISMLNLIGRNITSSLHIETVMNSIYQNIQEFLDVDLFGIGIYDKKKKELDYKFLVEDGRQIDGCKTDLSLPRAIAGWVIENKNAVLSNNIQQEYKKYTPELVNLSGGKTNSVIFVPLGIRREIIGVLTIQSYKLDAFTVKDLEMIQAIGSYGAIALENSRVHTEIYNLNKIIYKEKRELEQAYKKINSMANHDTLTGLPNRRLFMELLKKDILLCSREKTKLAVLFIDLDNFKPVNDTLGHDAGDRVLNIISSRFSNALRESDTIARLGGDEFTAIIKKVRNKKDVLKVVNKIIEKTVNPIKIGGKPFKLGASIGISFYPDDDDTGEGLVKKADEAMYRIKSSGKNGYSFYRE